MRTSVARHLAALRKANRKLDTYYRELPAPPTTPPQGQLFPYPSSFMSLLDNTTSNLHYQSAVDNSLLFRGLSNGRDVCVKYVRRYSKEAHEHCAQLGSAPQLLGFKALPGGWYMVVMDWLGSDKWSRLDEVEITFSDVNALMGKITQLHQSGYGHGDLRPTNILVSKSDPRQRMIIDFDWAGRLGEVCYPMNVNSVDIWRPKGVADEDPLLAEHDMSMLERLLPAHKPCSMFNSDP